MSTTHIVFRKKEKKACTFKSTLADSDVYNRNSTSMNTKISCSVQTTSKSCSLVIMEIVIQGVLKLLRKKTDPFYY